MTFFVKDHGEVWLTADLKVVFQIHLKTMTKRCVSKAQIATS